MEKAKTVKVGKVIIEIGKREIPLTLDEVKSLKTALCELLGEKVEHHHHSNWWSTGVARYYGFSYGDTYGGGVPGMAKCSMEAPSVTTSSNYVAQLLAGQDVTLSYSGGLTNE